jgi:hypothetical protein
MDRYVFTGLGDLGKVPQMEHSLSAICLFYLIWKILWEVVGNFAGHAGAAHDQTLFAF